MSENYVLETDSAIEAEPFPTDFSIHVVDDSDGTRAAIVEMVRSMSINAVGHKSAEAFLDAYDGEPAITVCDLRMPGMSGLELQSLLIDREVFMPFVLVTSFAKIRLVVKAIKNGATSVIEKPFKQDELWIALRTAIADYRYGFGQHNALRDARTRLKSLTSSERDVLRLLMTGDSNKVIAKTLDLSVRTVESRRHHIYEKMETENLVELVRQVELVRLLPSHGAFLQYSRAPFHGNNILENC